MKRRTLLAQTGSLALFLGLPHLAWGASLLAVRMWPSNDYTRVTIESDTPLLTQHQMLSAPERFVVDIQGMQLSDQVKELTGLVQPSDPYVAAIRVGQFQPDVVRIVFDLKQPITPNVFTLAPVAEYQNRLVFDFKPVNAPDPLSQLIDEVSSDRKQALSQGNRTEADILGDWLAQQKDTQPTSGEPQPEMPPASVTNGTATSHLPTPSKVPADTQGTTPVATSSTPATRPTRLYIIALDPGHGGEDPGAVGPSGTREKDIVLSVGKILRDQVNAQPNMRAFMTRDADFFVPLAERVNKARSVKADLFISIHADAFTNSSAKGASVFALSERGASSSAARWLANTQNASDLIGGVDVHARDRQTAGILLSMSTSAQIRDSMKLGKMVIDELKAFAQMHKNAVEQAGFAVLKAPDIPSILVETAFISNPEEEKKLRTPAYQKQLARAILNAIKKYLAQNPPVAARS